MSDSYDRTIQVGDRCKWIISNAVIAEVVVVEIKFVRISTQDDDFKLARTIRVGVHELPKDLADTTATTLDQIGISINSTRITDISNLRYIGQLTREEMLTSPYPQVRQAACDDADDD